MRKWVLRLITFLMSLTLGFLASFVWNAHRPISLCDIDANPDRYAGKIVRLRVIVSNDVSTGGAGEVSRLISACSICAGSDDWPSARLDLDPQQISLLPETKYAFGKETKKFFFVDAVVIGRFEPTDGITRCFSPKYDISHARIERVIANHELEGRAQAVQWLKSKSR
jgi:hypothetical protein